MTISPEQALRMREAFEKEYAAANPQIVDPVELAKKSARTADRPYKYQHTNDIFALCKKMFIAGAASAPDVLTLPTEVAFKQAEMVMTQIEAEFNRYLDAPTVENATKITQAAMNVCLSAVRGYVAEEISAKDKRLAELEAQQSIGDFSLLPKNVSREHAEIVMNDIEIHFNRYLDAPSEDLAILLTQAAMNKTLEAVRAHIGKAQPVTVTLPERYEVDMCPTQSPDGEWYSREDVLAMLSDAGIKILEGE